MNTSIALSNLKPSYIREILAATTTQKVISFAGGLPATESFPLELMQPAFTKVAEYSSLFQYGPTQGYAPLLELLQGYFNLKQTTEILMTNGSQQALDLLVRAYVNPGDVIVIEAPSYLGAIQVFRLAGAEIKEVTLCADGPDLKQLEHLFRDPKVRFYYAIPDFQNPSGLCYSLAKRKAVAKLCKQFDVTLIEDAPYHQLRFRGDELALLSSFCPEQSFVLHSFSKIACPGMRLGCVVAPKSLLAPLRQIKQVADLQQNTPLQYVLWDLLKNPSYSAHLQQLKSIYREKHDRMYDALQRELGRLIEVKPVKGGMFLWLEMNESVAVSATDFAGKAMECGVAIVPGDVFYQGGVNNKFSMRLNFSHPSLEEIDDGVHRISKLFKQLVI